MGSGEPRVTVVVATRNRAEELCRTLGRLGGLEPRPPVVVVDNGSTDGTAEAVRTRFPWVRLVRQEHNTGCVARNTGAALARTPYVAFCDDDSWWAPGSLEAAADALDACPRLALVAASVLVGSEERPDPVNEQMARSPLSDGGRPGPRVLGFLACAAVLRRSAFEQAGGFEPLLFFAGEEELLALDLAARGWELRHLPRAVVHHHPSEARPPDLWRRSLQERNALLTAWLRRSPAVAWERTARTAGRSLRDPVSRRALAGAVLRLPRAVARRTRLPERVERDLALLERT
ncbi:glycosyltransferase family 2 protein [Nocardiopsis algeriensis]|uniref:GT2 family glycosyltransferase n=1 Tax=Nocardiopsis algeriensis TaxID=1478215 RepID=A0A841J064_9ACTN|nr:glycosyltransferase [Nocardiopsis algeriensis]MBB6121898.1 GT2 family glycosyltransferase [Nocardiopsis algeriensis]